MLTHFVYLGRFPDEIDTRCNFLFSSIFQNFSEFLTAFQQLIYYIRLFFICQELFQNFFRSF